MTRVLPLGIAWAIASAATPARAAEPEPTVAVEVDVSSLPDEDFTRWLKEDLLERQKGVLRDGGIEVAEGADADATIRVTVSRYGELGVHYRASVALFEGEADTPKMEHTVTCELCKDSMLVTKVSEEVARMTGRFMYEREEAARAEGGDPEGEPAGSQSQPGDVDREPDVRRVGATGWVGIGLAVAGAGFGAGGAVELAKPATRELSSGHDRYETFTRPRPLGVALVGVGGGLLVAGAVLIVVDQTLLLERRRRRARRLSLLPAFSTTSVGLSWNGRF